jgi:hypothetical protein
VYAPRLEWKCKADPGNVRDEHKNYTVLITIRHMLNSATRYLNNSQARYKAWMRESSLHGPNCNTVLQLIACGI